MSRRGPLLALIGVLIALVVGLVVIFRLRLAQGDLFPAYSSLRGDPLGTLVLHDSLASLPGLAVERHLKPLARLEPTPPRTLVLAGVSAAAFRRTRAEDFAAVDAAVRAGARLIVAFRAHDAQRTRRDAPLETKAKRRASDASPPRERPDNPDSGDDDDAAAEAPRRAPPVDLQERWEIDLITDERIRQPDGAAEREAEGAEAMLPAVVPWGSDLFFRARDAAEWRVVYRQSGRPVLVERALGQGTIVLAADSYFLSNEALHRDRSSALLAWIVGPHGRVVFDEAHLGVAADPGIAALARRYGLEAAFFMFVLLAGLWVWRRMALFVPPPEEQREIAMAYHPAAGLEALLRRAVPPGELAAACAAEWRRTARPGDAARVEAAYAATPKKSSAAALHNAALRALRRR